MARRVALVVKYYPPSARISGVLGFVEPLARHLAALSDLHIVTSAVPGAPSAERVDGYGVERVGWPFPLRAGRAVASLRPDASMIVSSMYDLRKALVYFGLHSAMDGKPRRSAFYQATHPASPPNALFKRWVSRNDLVLCGATQMGRAFESAGIAPVELFTPGVDVAALAQVRPATHSEAFRVGFVNHLNHVKGFDVALDIFSRVASQASDVEFVIAGIGELEGDVPTTISGRRVHRHGFLPEGERLALMASCDVMVLPFRTGVSVLGVSQTVLECLALGVAVVGTDTASIAPAIDHGSDGLLMQEAEDGARHVLALHDDPVLRTRLSAAARDRAARDFDVRDRAELLDQLLFPRG